MPRIAHHLSAAATVALCHAGEPPQPAAPEPAPVAPAVEKVDEHTMRIGRITFRPETREIRIPTRVNMTEGLLEFALVHVNGKVHESLLVTEAGGKNLNIALKLLRYRPSEELFAIIDEDGRISDRFPKVAEDLRKAARVRMTVEWKDGGETKSALLNEWISYAITGRAMPHEPWIYGGSYVQDGRFAAESTGDLVAIFISRPALFNYAGADNNNDEVWTPMHGRVPPEGTGVTLVITPADAEPPNPSKP